MQRKIVNKAENDNNKPTNYRKLWRKAKIREVINNNFAENVIEAAKKSITDKKKLNEFMKYVEYLRNLNTKAYLEKTSRI